MQDFRRDKELLSMTESKDKDGENLLEANNLIYTAPMNLSTTSMRTLRRYDAMKTNYTSNSGSMIFYIQSGADYVDFSKSVLRFKLYHNGTDATDYGFGIGSSLNIIRDIIITAKSGRELGRIQRANVYYAHRDRQRMSRDKMQSVGSLIGYKVIDDADDTKVDVDADSLTDIKSEAKAIDYTIPLSHLHGLFDIDQLAPAGLASGLKIELFLENPATAIVGADDQLTNYTVVNPYILCDCHTLNDDTARKLNDISTRNGLEILYRATHMNSDSGTKSVFNVESNKAASRVLGGMIVARASGNLGLATADSIKSVPYTDAGDAKNSVVEYQYKVGSSYFPFQPVRGESEAFYNQLYSNDKLGKHPSLVDAQRYNAYTATYNAKFETADVIANSGLAVNNSQNLSTNVKYGQGVAFDLSLFLDFTMLIRVYPSNVVPFE